MKAKTATADLSGICNQLPNPVLIHVGGKVVFANDLVLAVTGYSREGILGKDVAGLLTDPADAKNTALFRMLAGEALPVEKEFEIRTENRKTVIRNFLVRNSKISYQGREAVMTVLVDITERKHLEKYVLSRVLETEERDRKKFAADLHDDLGPILSSIKLHLGLLEHARNPEKFAETLAICNLQLTEAIAKMRLIANNLMPRLLDNFGLEAALQAFIGNLPQKEPFRVRFRSNLNGRRFSRPTELHLYRILGELVNNTIRHAGATEAAISLNIGPELLQLTYSDNGKGYDVRSVNRKPGGMGVANILQRVKLMDAEIRFARRNGKTVVSIRKEI